MGDLTPDGADVGGGGPAAAPDQAGPRGAPGSNEIAELGILVTCDPAP